MLYDKKWDTQVELEKWQKALLDAAQYLRRHGWCQGRICDAYNRVCVMGALMGIHAPQETYDKLAERFPNNTGYPTKYSHIVDWNDKLGRTEEEVITALEETAFSK